jgi:4'-phosphopantetheinyl transferase
VTSSVNPEGVWPSPPGTLALGRDEVHVWRFSLDGPQAGVASLGMLLAPEERERARRHRFGRDRRRFVVGRGTLRRILSPYVGCPAERLPIGYGSHGKPELGGAKEAARRLQFNLAHSRDTALLAVSRDRRLGIDLEWIRRVDEARIAARFFSRGERTAVLRQQGAARRRSFFSCWTRKESYVKATGLGLSIPLQDFEVQARAGQPAQLLRTEWNQAEASRWRLCDLPALRGYAAALAVEGHDWRLRCFAWPPCTAVVERPVRPRCAWG